MKPLSLRTRLTLYYALVLAVLLSGFGIMAYDSQARVLERSLLQELQDRAAAVRGYLRYVDGQLVLAYDSNDQDEAYFIHSATRFYQAFDMASGALLVQSRDLELMDVHPSFEELEGLARREQMEDVETAQGVIRFHNSVFETNGRRFLIRVGISLQPMLSAIEDFRQVLLLLIPAGLLLVVVGGWQMARWALRPTRDLASAARRINVERLNERLPLRGSGDEIDQLAEAFNSTLAQLEDSVAQMQQFTASISHELRTPLTALRGEAEVALLEAQSVEDYRRLLSSQLEEMDKLTQMVKQLTTLARAQAGEIRVLREPVELAALVLFLAEQMEPVAASRNVELKVEGASPVMVLGDPQWLERLILNLLDNAIKFTPAGGRISISARALPHAAILEVEDTGVGIMPASLPHVFDRFFREEPSRSKDVEGIGLGLTLVKWIVDQHHGRVRVESQPGKGSRFTVELELASPPNAARHAVRPASGG